jgi:hypothetical protein
MSRIVHELWHVISPPPLQIGLIRLKCKEMRINLNLVALGYKYLITTQLVAVSFTNKKKQGQ